ncbi:hypothetical protein ACFL3S_09150 [Gemmatimonadota bacterium]
MIRQPSSLGGSKRCTDVDLEALGVLALAVWGTLATLWLLRGRPGHLLWLSDVAMLASALGLLLRSRIILTAQFVGILAFHLIWQVDLASYVLWGRMPLGVTSYVVSGLTPLEEALSIFQHGFVILATAWAILRLGASRKGWLFQTFLAGAVVALTYLLTAPAHNVNWVFGLGIHDLPWQTAGPPAFHTALLFLGPPLLLFLPTNALANVLGASALADRVRCKRSGFHLAVALGGTALLGGFSWLVSAALPGPTQSVPRFTDLSIPAIDAIPVRDGFLDVRSISYGIPGNEVLLPLLPLDGSLSKAVSGSGLVTPINLKRILGRFPIEAIPGAPARVVIRGRVQNSGLALAAVVVSTVPYPQPGVGSATVSGEFTVNAQLGRAGLDEFRLAPEGGAILGGKDPYIVGNGIGALYAVVVLGLEGGVPLARTRYFLFKRTGIEAPGDLDPQALKELSEP